MTPLSFSISLRLNTLRRVLRESSRMYFAPIVGAFKGIRAEYRLIDRDIRRARNLGQ